jgi:hypothetical protein
MPAVSCSAGWCLTLPAIIPTNPRRFDLELRGRFKLGRQRSPPTPSFVDSTGSLVEE